VIAELSGQPVAVRTFVVCHLRECTRPAQRSRVSRSSFAPHISRARPSFFLFAPFFFFFLLFLLFLLLLLFSRYIFARTRARRRQYVLVRTQTLTLAPHNIRTSFVRYLVFKTYKSDLCAVSRFFFFFFFFFTSSLVHVYVITSCSCVFFK
jgi:hypothetical protein